MSTDPQTLAFYNANAKDYGAFAEGHSEHPKLTAFLESMPEAAKILDFGCGTAWAAAEMAKAGHTPDAIDASEGLAAQALETHGITVRVAPFHTLSYRARYHGIWCHFALQHAVRDTRTQIFERINTALKPGGLFYIAAQKGPRDWRDDLGRLYCPFREDELTALLEEAGFKEWEIGHGTGKNYDGTPTLNLYATAHA